MGDTYPLVLHPDFTPDGFKLIGNDSLILNHKYLTSDTRDVELHFVRNVGLVRLKVKYNIYNNSNDTVFYKNLKLVKHE